MNHPEPIPGSRADAEPQHDRKRPDLPLSPWDKKETLPYWVRCSREFDEILITHHYSKAMREIALHVARRESEKRGCDEGRAGIAHWTRCHIKTVGRCIRRLVRDGFLIRERRPGDTSVLRLVDKLQWMKAHPPGGAPVPAPEETDRDLPGQRNRELWDRAYQLMPQLADKPFERMMKKDIDLFERVLNEVEDRVKHAVDPKTGQTKDPRYQAAARGPIKNVVGLFVDIYRRWSEADPKESSANTPQKEL